MKKKEKAAFNPNDFDSLITIKELVEKFDYLLTLNYKEISLAKEIIPLNYEIVSKDYKDFLSSDIKDYYSFEIDMIV